MRQLELADAALRSAPVSAGRRAEELDLQQGVRNGGDVDGDQRLVGAAGGAVDRMRQQLLPVPVSPSSSSPAAPRRARRLTSRLAGLLPTKLESCTWRGARLRQRLARGDQLGLQARIMAEERRQRLELVEQREAHRPDHIAPQVADRQARDHQRSRSVSMMSSRMGSPDVTTSRSRLLGMTSRSPCRWRPAGRRNRSAPRSAGSSRRCARHGRPPPCLRSTGPACRTGTAW